MAAYINRTMVQPTKIGGDSQLRSSDIRNDNSPLQIFVKAKKRINDIFVDIRKYVEETVEFMTCEYKKELFSVFTLLYFISYGFYIEYIYYNLSHLFSVAS